MWGYTKVKKPADRSRPFLHKVTRFALLISPKAIQHPPPYDAGYCEPDKHYLIGSLHDLVDSPLMWITQQVMFTHKDIPAS